MNKNTWKYLILLFIAFCTNAIISAYAPSFLKLSKNESSSNVLENQFRQDNFATQAIINSEHITSFSQATSNNTLIEIAEIEIDEVNQHSHSSTNSTSQFAVFFPNNLELSTTSSINKYVQNWFKTQTLFVIFCVFRI